MARPPLSRAVNTIAMATTRMPKLCIGCLHLASELPSQAPSNQSSLRALRIILDPIDRLPAQPGGLRDLRNAHSLLSKYAARGVELLPREARLAAKVGAVIIQLGVLDTGPLCGLGVGYVYDQVSADRGSAPILGPIESRVFGVGPQVGYLFPVGNMQGALNLKAYFEFDSHDRPSGWNTWLTFSISPAAPPAPTPPMSRAPMIYK